MEEFAKDFSPSPEREKLIVEYENQTQATKKMLELNSELLKGLLKESSPIEISSNQLKMVTEKITEKIDGVERIERAEKTEALPNPELETLKAELEDVRAKLKALYENLGLDYD